MDSWCRAALCYSGIGQVESFTDILDPGAVSLAFPHEWLIHSISAKQIQGFPAGLGSTLECPVKHRVCVAGWPAGFKLSKSLAFSPVHQNKSRLCRRHVCLQQLAGNYPSIHDHCFCPQHRNIQTGLGSSPWEWRSHTEPRFTVPSTIGLQKKKNSQERFQFLLPWTAVVYLPPPAAWCLPSMTSWPLFPPGNTFHPWSSCYTLPVARLPLSRCSSFSWLRLPDTSDG